MKKLNAFILLFLFFTSINLYADSYIEGTIYIQGEGNKKLPAQRARVFWEEHSESGVLTDANGKFKLERHSHDHNLKVVITGYEEQIFNIEQNKTTVELVVMPSFKTKDVKVEGMAPGTIVSRAELQKTEEITMQGLRKAACCNLAESFETNASVDVNYSDAVTGAKQIQLLGLDGIYTQIMYEKIPTATGIASKYGLAYIPGPWMESIQISKGAATVQTGYESITGQINVEYKKPFNDEKLHLNAYADNHQRFEANLNSSYELNDSWATTILAHGSIYDNEIDYNRDGFMDTPLFSLFNIMNRWEYDSHNFEMRFGVKALAEERKSGQMGFHKLDNNDGLYGIGIQSKRYEAFFKPGYVFPTIDLYSIGLITNVVRHEQKSYFGNRTYDANQTSAYANLIYESSLKYDFDIGKDIHCYNIGFSYRYDNYEEFLNDSLMNRQEFVPGVFAEYTYNGIKDLTITSGIRNDYHNIFGNYITPRIHIRYEPIHNTVIRASAGKGWRVSNIYAENPGLLASSRQLIISEKLKPVESWNYGINFSSDVYLFRQQFAVNVEFYRTDFVNQVIVDMEQSPQQVHFYNLDGKSYSNSFQIDATFSPISGLEIMSAYRLNDVWETVNGQFQEKRLMSRHKAFLNMNYLTPSENWSFDVTGVYNGSGKLPNTDSNPEQYRLGKTFPAYFTMLAQVTRRFGQLEFYIGSENLTNYIQRNPILGADNPFGEYFDSSIIWGPIAERKIYTGVRWTL